MSGQKHRPWHSPPDPTGRAAFRRVRWLLVVALVARWCWASPPETFSITIQPPTPLVVATETLSNRTVGEFYCCGNLFASGGVPTYARSVVSGELPPGLELPRRENTISGTPTAAGTFTFTVQVTDERGTTAEKEFTITVS